MPFACIDIGSNTTRLLVAEPANGGLRELLGRRAFTRLGAGVQPGGAIPAAKLAEVADVVASQAGLAREHGVRRLRTVATGAIRVASNGRALLDAVRRSSRLDVAILSEREEARLAFLGATRTHGKPVSGEVAVADVGGSSSELAVGTVDGGPVWWTSFPIGSGLLADAHLRSNPPSEPELSAVRRHVESVLGELPVDPPQLAIAVGGSATSLLRMGGPELGAEALDRALRLLAATPIPEVARRFGVEPERARLLPAGLLVLQAIATRLRRPLRVGNGGLREGVILELIEQAQL